jgi:hypothetical protein
MAPSDPSDRKPCQGPGLGHGGSLNLVLSENSIRAGFGHVPRRRPDKLKRLEDVSQTTSLILELSLGAIEGALLGNPQLP